MQQVDDPPSLPVGTEVSAKYKGAFCEAKVRKVVRNIKVKVAYKQGLGSGIVPDDAIKSGVLRVGSTVEVKHPDKREIVEATVTKIQDCSQYTVVFDDGDITTLRRTALCLKSGRHFNESETLDQLPLTHPEHFGNPVVGGRRGRRSRHLHEESSDEDEESDAKEIINEKEENIGKVVCVESTETKKKDKDKWFPGLVVAPTAQVTVRIRVKDEYLVRSFKDGRYYTVPKKEATEFTREAATKQDGPAVQAALEYLDNDVLPPHWDRDALFGLSNSSSDYEGEIDSDSSDDEPREEKDHFVAQLYKYMDDRGTPLNKVPSIQNRDVDLYRLFRAVQKLGGYNRVTSQNQWKSITIRLGFTPVTVSVTNLVKQAYKKFLQPYEDFHRKLGCSMIMTPRNSNRSKGRSLVRASSVASPKPADAKEPKAAQTPPASNSVIAVPSTSLQQTAAADESGNTSESSLEVTKSKRKTSVGSGKVKNLVDKFEDKLKEDREEAVSGPSGRSAPKTKEEKSTNDGSNILPISGGTTVKKEKFQKKPPALEEKRGRKKKDVESADKADKSDKSSDSAASDFPLEVGDRLKVYYHEKKVTYEAKVIEISVQQETPLYLVHYTGWNNRYDEWVPRERIAENLSNNKNKKNKASQSEKAKSDKGERSTGGPPPMPAAKTPTTALSKRGRGRSDSQPPRSTTPSSVASNSSRTKSPAASTAQRRTTRTKPSTIRRPSNNVSDNSMQTESDTDSDEPVKKPAARITREKSKSSSATSSKIAAASTTATNSPSDSDDDEPVGNSLALSSKGRDYDLNQIRSELKGFKALKSPTPEPEQSNQEIGEGDSKKATSVFEFPDKDASPTDARKDDLAKSSTDVSSETDSFGDEDSQSSDKTTTLENMTEKLQQKVKAEKIAQAQALQTQGSKGAEKATTQAQATSDIEKVLKHTLAEKRQETLKNQFFIEKSIFKSTPPSAPADITPPIDKSPLKSDAKSPLPGRLISIEKPSAVSTATIVQQLPTTSTSASTVAVTPVKIGRYQLAGSKLSPETTPSALKVLGEKSTPAKDVALKTGKFISIASATASSLASSSSDIYEFKEPEPFEFEARKPIVGQQQQQVQVAPMGQTENEKLKRKPTIQKPSEDIRPTPSTGPAKKKKVSPVKDSAADKSKQVAKETVDKCKAQLKDLVEKTKQQLKFDDKPEPKPEPPTVALVPPPVVLAPVISTPQKSETTFDALRKSPSFNLNINALNEELATTVQETTKALTDVPPILEHLSTPTKVEKKPLTFVGSPFIETKSDISNVFELDAEGKPSTSEGTIKPTKSELETVKKILLDESFDLEPPKIEKPSSIADKVLKAISQKKEEEEKKEKDVKVEEKEEESTVEEKPEPESVAVPSPIPIIATGSGTSLTEPLKIDPIPPALIKKEFELALRKPILNSPEHKIDILESIAPKNNDLSETIQKLESAIQKTTTTISNVAQFDEESSDSTDSERRLVIEDDEEESAPAQVSPAVADLLVPVTQVQQPKPLKVEEVVDSKAFPGEVFVLKREEVAGAQQSQVSVTSYVVPPQSHQRQQPPSQSQQPPPSIFGMQAALYSDSSLLSDAGVKPIIESPIAPAGGVEPLLPNKLQMKFNEVTPGTIPDVIQLPLANVAKKEEPMTLLSSAEPTGLHSDSINLLLCEETIPGSPTPVIKDFLDSASKASLHPIESDIKPVPMDIECPASSSIVQGSAANVTSAASAESKVKTESQTPDNSPHYSLSQDESSEDIKKQLDLDGGEVSPKKRRRSRKHSEVELLPKRRRNNPGVAVKKNNGSDSDDNSDTASQRSTSHKPVRPCQFNFLVQLDPALNPNQRITILRKKIQELRKTYNMVKAELASIDRRRKKLRRREREKKQQAKMNA